MNEPPEVFLAEVVESPAPSPNPAEPKSLMDQILNPHMLQRMMQLGGGILVLGFVVWLWSIGIFENPLVVAGALGAITLSVLVGGVALVRYTRYQMAGTGMTLLACLAMPLNLWLYDAQELITIANGGHLWVPAAICCGIYALVARVLRRPSFVYAFVGGIVLTGMLFLADQAIGRFWCLLPPASFLVIIGWICVCVEQLFPRDSGDFSRENFGKAFYRSGHIAIGCGLALILAGHIGAVLPANLVSFDSIQSLASDATHKLWALALIVGSALGFGALTLAGRDRTTNTVNVIGLTAWSIVSLMDVFSIPLRFPYFVIVLAMIVIIANLLLSRISKPKRGSIRATATKDGRESVADRGMRSFARFVAAGTGLLALIQFALCCQTILSAAEFGIPLRWMVADHPVMAMQMFFIAMACWTTGVRFDSRSSTIVRYSLGCRLIGVLVATLGAVLAGLSISSLTWNTVSPGMVASVGMLIPIGFAVAIVTRQRLLSGGGGGGGGGDEAGSIDDRSVTEQTVFGILPEAVFVSLSVLICVLVAMVAIGVLGAVSNLSISAFLAVSSALFFIASRGPLADVNRVAGGLAATVASGFAMSAFGLGLDYSLVVCASLCGSLLVLISAAHRRFPMARLGKVAESLDLPGKLMVLMGGTMGVLLAFSRMIDCSADGYLAGVLGIQLAGILSTGFLSRSVEWRLTFRVAGLATVSTLVLVINALTPGNPVLKAEISALALGMACLVAGHIAWSREGALPDSSATLLLWLGSFLSTVPIGLGLLIHRGMHTTGGVMLFHEIGVVIVGLVLVLAGSSCRIRATALCGSGLLAMYVTSLVALIRLPSALQNVSIVMMIGGGAFFIVAILLSVYRDRLLALPERVREGEGIFRVIRWR